MSKSQISLFLKWVIAKVLMKQQIHIYIGNQMLEPKDTAKYLGAYVDKRLYRDRHIEHINSKFNCGIGILRKLRS